MINDVWGFFPSQLLNFSTNHPVQSEKNIFIKTQKDSFFTKKN
jgi:hypothetical protein